MGIGGVGIGGGWALGMWGRVGNLDSHFWRQHPLNLLNPIHGPLPNFPTNQELS